MHIYRQFITQVLPHTSLYHLV